MTFHIVTLFPESFDSYVSSSIIGRALRNGKIKIKFYNPREFTPDKWRRVDHRPYGGGPGMVLEAQAVVKAVDKALKSAKGKNTKIIWLSPSGKQFDNAVAEKYAKKVEHLVIICGRYEGIDARVKKIFKTEDISVGPFVLTGGELPAMIILDTVSRRLPGVLGKIESIEENRISSEDVYTRPEVLAYKGKKYRVPKVLLSGNHSLINNWRQNRKK
jgi:tRNA (guanine37-N1)-methyltransferase